MYTLFKKKTHIQFKSIIVTTGWEAEYAYAKKSTSVCNNW